MDTSMSTQVSVIFKEGPRKDDVLSVLREVVGLIEVKDFPPSVGLDGHFRISFYDPADPSDKRELTLDFDAHDEEALQDDVLQDLAGLKSVHMSLGAHGSARAILQHVAARFDGWICDESVDDEYVKAADFDQLKGLSTPSLS